MFFRSLLYPKIKRDNDYSKMELAKIVVIPIDENTNQNTSKKINNFYDSIKQKKSPYVENDSKYLLEICNNV